MHRYLGFIWFPKDADSVRSMQILERTLTQSPSEWVIGHKAPGALVIHTGISQYGGDAYPLCNGSGVVLGELLPSSGNYLPPHKVLSFDHAESLQIIESKGQRLVDRYWGRYVAFFKGREPQSHHVLSDPTGQMPCFHAKWKGISIFFSHIEDCVRCVPMPFILNTRHLAAHLVSNGKYTWRTGLKEVESITGGELQTVTPSGLSRTILWHPERLFRKSPIEDEKKAADELRETVQAVINARVARHARVLHGLSGGLDSSIVAGCLAQAPTKPQVTCLNMFFTQAVPLSFSNLGSRHQAKLKSLVDSGDERPFARLVADLWKFPLFEQEITTSYNLSAMWNAPLAPLPSRFVQYIDQDAAELRIVRERQITGVLNGQAGDELFFATLLSAGALDYAYSHGFGRRFLTEIKNTCRLYHEPMLLILYEALKHGILRRPKVLHYNALKNTHLMHEDLVASLTSDDIAHPWQKTWPRLPPAKHWHLLALANSAFYSQFTFHRERYADSILVLNSQPIAELCMRIPTYVLLAGGVSRGLARRAFADLLPPQILKRTRKGNVASFARPVLQGQMEFVRSALLDGQLVHEGILDRKKLEAYLVPGQPFLQVNESQVMFYLSGEAWLRRWKEIQQQRAAA